MKITNIGGATAILEHRGKRMLLDPWLDDGIFHGSWFHYPPAKMRAEDVGRLDYIYISHIHEDHCSAGTIRHLNRDAEVILMDREPNYVMKFLAANRFYFRKIHLIKPRSPVEIAPGLRVDMLTADPAHYLNYAIDSALVLDWDGFVIYDANDCAPYPDGLDYLKHRYARVDLALMPYSGGSGYPACYANLSHEEKLKEKERIFRFRLADFVQNVGALDPVRVMPFADQYVIGGSRSHLNAYLPHPPGPGVTRRALEEAGLAAKIVLLNSGQGFDLESQRKVPDEPYRDHTEEDRDRYVKDRLQNNAYDHEKIGLSPAVPFDRLVASARVRLLWEQKKENFSPRYSYYLEIPDRGLRYHLPLDSEDVRAVENDEACEPPYLKISAPATLMAFLLIGHVSWNIADAALFLDYERVPNRYDPQIHAYVNYLRI